MSIGVVVSQAIMFVISPVLTRIYSPKDFGLFGIFTSISSVLCVLANGRYQVPIVLPKKDREAVNVFALSILFTLGLSLLLVGIIFFFNHAITSLFHTAELSKWLYFVPLTVLLNGLYEPVFAWAVRKKRYGTLSWTRVTQSVSSSLYQVVAGFLKAGGSGLILGRIVGDSIRAIYAWGHLLRNDRKRRIFFDFKAIKFSAIKYRDFLRFEATLTVLKTFTIEMPVFFLTSLFSPTVTGFYLLSVRVISGPFSILQLSMNQVFYKEMTDRFHLKQDFYPFVKKTYLNLLKIAIIPHIVLLFLAPLLFKIVFGANWINSGHMTQLMIPTLLLSFLNSPMTVLSPILNKQKTLLCFELIQLALVSSLMAGSAFWFHNELITIAAMSFGMTAYHLFLMGYLIRISKNVDYEDVYKH